MKMFSNKRNRVRFLGRQVQISYYACTQLIKKFDFWKTNWQHFIYDISSHMPQLFAVIFNLKSSFCYKVSKLESGGNTT